MRPRLIAGIESKNPDASPFERFEEFARKIAAVPKVEADRVQANEIRKKKKISKS